jgi:hypothetical protein
MGLECRFFPSHVEYNAMYAAIKADKDWFIPFLNIVAEYYETEPCGGSCHCSLDDGNLGDGTLDWEAGYACGTKDVGGGEIANLMRAMTMKQRKRIYNSYPYTKTKKED